MPLTDAAVRNAKPAERTRKLFDGGGLYLEVPPRGNKRWRLKYRFRRREKRISLGTYPDVSLRDARERRDAARALLAKGVDPSAQRRSEREAGAGTFDALAREWLATRGPRLAPGYATRVRSSLERFVLPYLGDCPIATLAAPEILAVLRRIESRGTGETAYRVRQVVGQVFRYAIATGRAERDPTADLRGALAPVQGRHFPAATEPVRVGEILRMLDAHQGEPTVSAALRVAPYVFARPGELRTMRWADVELERREWRYVVPKTRRDHLVPLARQVVEILRSLEPLTCEGEYVFRGLRGDRPISDMALGAALRRLGIDTRTEHTMHGWRATARTLLHERLGWAPEVIEHQLAHRVPDALGEAYNRTRFLPERRRMMQAWADYLDGLKRGGDVVPLRGRTTG